MNVLLCLTGINKVIHALYKISLCLNSLPSENCVSITFFIASPYSRHMPLRIQNKHLYITHYFSSGEYSLILETIIF